jgi:hypothetical protein
VSGELNIAAHERALPSASRLSLEPAVDGSGIHLLSQHCLLRLGALECATAFSDVLPRLVHAEDGWNAP